MVLWRWSSPHFDWPPLTYKWYTQCGKVKGINLRVERHVTDGHKQHWYVLDQRPNRAMRQNTAISYNEISMLYL